MSARVFNKVSHLTIDAAMATMAAEKNAKFLEDFLGYVQARAERSWYADKELTPLETSVLPEAIRKIVDINETIDFDISLTDAVERMRSAENPGCRAIDILEVVYGKISRMKREPLGAIERCFYEAAARRSDLYNTYYG